MPIKLKTGRNEDGSFYAFIACEAGMFIREGATRRDAFHAVLSAVESAFTKH